jgi:GTP-binding protein Era
MKSGFVAVVGRTGVGKSTLVNEMVGTKVSITSKHRNTTRFAIRGILNDADSQIIFVDTPGFHKPQTRLGERLNSVASDYLSGVDCVLYVVDATESIGPGDSGLAAKLDRSAICVVNKVDRAKSNQVIERLVEVSKFEFSEYFPVSARTGQGVAELVDEVRTRLPDGPRYYPRDVVSDMEVTTRVAELVREQLLKKLKEELPHSVACQVTHWDGAYLCCDIYVERESQKPIVIGKNASVLKEVGSTVRSKLEEELSQSIYLDLRVKVNKEWQSNDRLIDRIGYGVGDN